MVTHNYQELISVENLFQAWSEFKKGKRKRKDVQIFERNLEDNLFKLHRKLKSKTYQHGDYHVIRNFKRYTFTKSEMIQLKVGS